MTFEYRDPDYDLLRVEPAPHHSDGPRIILHAEFTHDLGTDMAEVAVPLDRVEEVIAGIRDAARTASGQQPETTPCCSACGHPIEPFYGNDWIHTAGSDTGCLRATPAIGQPAEAQATDGALTAAERKFLHFALDQAADEMSLGDGFTDEDEAALAKLRLLAGKDER